ncbi:MAG: hypothetical protein QW734_08955 [Candidatus Bathyarchaeia archaeon]
MDEEENEKEEPTPDISKETQKQLLEDSRKSKTLAEVISDLLKHSKRKKSVLYDEFLEG